MKHEGRIVTFYSYKGGVGRSMALANVSVLLAQWGYKVLAIDFDLEAPGLENFYESFIDVKEVKYRRGVVEFLREYLTSETSRSATELEIDPVHVRLPRTEGALHLWNAGVRDDEYFRKVRCLDFPEIYAHRNGGFRVEEFRKWLKAHYDFVLLDSRTGLTDIGGICTVHLPDMIVMLSTPTDQALTGGLDIINRAAKSRQRLPYPRPVIPTIPIPSRLDMQAEFRLSQKWLDRFRHSCDEVFADWLPREVKDRHFLELLKLPHVSFFSFGESLPVIEYGTSDPGGLGQAYENLAALIANNLQDVGLLIENRSSYINKASATHLPKIEPRRPTVFISYHHNDKKWLDQLRTHLAPLSKSRDLTILSDSHFAPGTDWREEFDNQISSAEVAVLLVSPDYLASEFILDKELPLLLKASEERGLRILIVSVRAALVEETMLSSFQFANDPKMPISTLSESAQETVLNRVAKEIASAAGRSY